MAIALQCLCQRRGGDAEKLQRLATRTDTSIRRRRPANTQPTHRQAQRGFFSKPLHKAATLMKKGAPRAVETKSYVDDGRIHHGLPQPRCAM